MNQSLFHAGGLKPRDIPTGMAILVSAVRRRYGHTYNSILFVRTECKGDTTRGKRKLKQGQKTAFPFPLMVSPLHTSSLHPYSLPFFIPLYFACRRRPNPFHLFAPISIAMFSGLGFTPFFYLLFFGSLEGNFISVLLVMLSDFTDYIEYLLLVLLGSVVGICYIVRYKLNYCICRQTDFVGKRSLPLRLQQPDSSAPS